jgi:hypothetical protein
MNEQTWNRLNRVKNNGAAGVIRQTAVQYLQAVPDYALINELQRRIEAMQANRGCLSDEFISKLENLKNSAQSVKIHL